MFLRKYDMKYVSLKVCFYSSLIRNIRFKLIFLAELYVVIHEI